MPQLEHPAMLAGLLSHLKAGDSLAPAPLCFAANVAAGLPLAESLRQLAAAAEHKPTKAVATAAEQFAMLAGVAMARQAAGRGEIVAALVPESALTTALLRTIADQHLPLVLITLASRLPEPGESQNHSGVPQIAVGAEDVVAQYRVMQESVHRARTGIGPTWIACCVPQRPRGTSYAEVSLRSMENFLALRNLLDAAQPKRERNAFAAEWKAALQSHKRPATDATSALPVSGAVWGLDLFQ